MRTLLHIMLGCLVALGTSQMPWILSLVVITQAAIAKAQYDIYHADCALAHNCADAQLRSTDIIAQLLSSVVVLIITRLYL